MADWYDRYQEFSKSEWAPTQLSEKEEGRVQEVAHKNSLV